MAATHCMTMLPTSNANTIINKNNWMKKRSSPLILSPIHPDKDSLTDATVITAVKEIGAPVRGTSGDSVIGDCHLRLGVDHFSLICHHCHKYIKYKNDKGIIPIRLQRLGIIVMRLTICITLIPVLKCLTNVKIYWFIISNINYDTPL